MAGQRELVRRATIVMAVLLATIGVLVGVFYGGLEPGDELWPVGWVIWAPVGGLILWRRPGNGIGTTMLTIGLSWGIGFFTAALAERVMDDFAGSLRDRGDTDEVVEGWLGVVEGTMESKAVGVWLR